MRLSNNPASANKCKSTAYIPMAVQHRGLEGASVVEKAADCVDDEGKEQMPNGILSRLKSELGGMSIQDFIVLFVAFYFFGSVEMETPLCFCFYVLLLVLAA